MHLRYIKSTLIVKKTHGVELHFQQDGAKCHTSDLTKAKIGQLSLKNIGDFWPANSPDLSPIELVWREVEKQLRMKQYKDLEEMKSALIHIWNRIPVELCQNLIATFDKRLKWVKNNQGYQYAHYAKGVLSSDGQVVKLDEISKQPKVIYSWDHPWNLSTTVEKVIINMENLQLLKSKYMKSLSSTAEKTLKEYLTGSSFNSKQYSKFKEEKILPMLCEREKISNFDVIKFYDLIIPERAKVLSTNMLPSFSNKVIFGPTTSKALPSTKADMRDDSEGSAIEGNIKFQVIDYTLTIQSKARAELAILCDKLSKMDLKVKVPKTNSIKRPKKEASSTKRSSKKKSVKDDILASISNFQSTINENQAEINSTRLKEIVKKEKLSKVFSSSTEKDQEMDYDPYSNLKPSKRGRQSYTPASFPIKSSMNRPKLNYHESEEEDDQEN